MSTKRQNQVRRASVYAWGITLLCLLFSSQTVAQQIATISNPPTTARAGDTINITVTVWNPGTNQTAVQTLRLLLIRSETEAHSLGTHPVYELGGGQISTRTKVSRIPLEARGLFKVRACLESQNTSCTASGVGLTSAGQINVTPPPPAEHVLTVRFVGDGRGKVTDSISGFNCSGGTCTKIIRDGRRVRLTKEVGELSKFGGWSSVACGGEGDCEFHMRRDTTVTATFDRTHYKVTARVSLSGGGNGSVSGGQEFEMPP
ncbi:MAG TPA: hypothetical protein VFX96_07115, partial [Pyrinomonadaceae bacterium]|nr:hypothetical protein [Pyrinomonadaceae bacterium]